MILKRNTAAEYFTKQQSTSYDIRCLAIFFFYSTPSHNLNIFSLETWLYMGRLLVSYLVCTINADQDVLQIRISAMPFE